MSEASRPAYRVTEACFGRAPVGNSSRDKFLPLNSPFHIRSMVSITFGSLPLNSLLFQLYYGLRHFWLLSVKFPPLSTLLWSVGLQKRLVPHLKGLISALCLALLKKTKCPDTFLSHCKHFKLHIQIYVSDGKLGVSNPDFQT